MSLDTRARHAVRSLQDTVVRATPVALPTVTRRHRASLIAGLAGALAIALGSIALASFLPESNGDDTATVTSLIPDPEIPDGQLVALPEHGDEIEGIHQRNATSESSQPYSFFYGAAEPGTVVTAYSPYGVADTVAGEDGVFELKLYFEEAPLGVTFPVTLTVGDEQHEFHFTWLWDPYNIDITAHQGYASSDSPEPFEKFFGTAPPGTAVEITSEYGSASTEAGEGGEWYAKVWFSGQPAGEPFPITVTVGDQEFHFSFLWLNDGLGITVHQEGTVSDSPSPYTRFIGTAPVGTVVLATSAYGSADLVVGESGEFSLKVWFNGAPDGVKFPITLKFDGETYDADFFFTWHQPDGGGSGEAEVVPVVTASESPSPYAKVEYWAPDDTLIQLVSPYGSSSVMTTYAGEGHLKLFFSPLPPAGQPFTVTIKVNGQVYDTFQFTSWFDGEIETTVNAYNLSSESPEPSVKFYGTAPLGSFIEIISEYGSWSWTTEAYEWNSGHKYFESLPPAGEAFPITVKVNGESFGPFMFTSWYEATDISAHFTFGECAENPPFDVYYGTAPAGTLVKIYSEYSSLVQVYANGDGNWGTGEVFFPSAPVGVTFTVTVRVGNEYFYFNFTRTA